LLKIKLSNKNIFAVYQAHLTARSILPKIPFLAKQILCASAQIKTSKGKLANVIVNYRIFKKVYGDNTHPFSFE
jgi:hypothetical protein